jgi:hypothetical protein
MFSVTFAWLDTDIDIEKVCPDDKHRFTDELHVRAPVAAGQEGVSGRGERVKAAENGDFGGVDGMV